MKKELKDLIITAIVMVVIIGGAFGAWEIVRYRNRPKYSFRSLFVYIDADYKNEFLNREFSPEDLGAEYAENIRYECWVDKGNGETRGYGVLYVELKTTDKRRYKRAVKAFGALPFVLKTVKNPFVPVQAQRGGVTI